LIKRIGRFWPMLAPLAVGIYFAFLANGAPLAHAQFVSSIALVNGVYGANGLCNNGGTSTTNPTPPVGSTNPFSTGLCLNQPPPLGYYLTTNTTTLAPGQTFTFSSPSYYSLTSPYGAVPTVGLLTNAANAYGPFIPSEVVTCNLYTNNGSQVFTPYPGSAALEEPPGTGPSNSLPPTTINTTIQSLSPSIIWASTSVYAGLGGAVTGQMTLPSLGPPPGSYFVVLCWGNTSFRTAAGPNPAMFFFGGFPQIPEASTLLLFGGGLSGLAGYAGLKLRGIRNRIGL
jgi:hypothetical protein